MICKDFYLCSQFSTFYFALQNIFCTFALVNSRWGVCRFSGGGLIDILIDVYTAFCSDELKSRKF